MQPKPTCTPIHTPCRSVWRDLASRQVAQWLFGTSQNSELENRDVYAYCFWWSLILVGDFVQISNNNSTFGFRVCVCVSIDRLVFMYTLWYLSNVQIGTAPTLGFMLMVWHFYIYIGRALSPTRPGPEISKVVLTSVCVVARTHCTGPHTNSVLAPSRERRARLGAFG